MVKMRGQRRAVFNSIFPYAVLILSSHFVFATQASSEMLSEERRAELYNLLLQDCGSCHGMTLKGGLGPALTPEALKDKPREFIELTIREGRSGTPMPPWKGILSQDEIHWLVNILYTGIKP